MTTSFTKEWSDDDSSHSSEEFLFVKGAVAGSTAKPDEGKMLLLVMDMSLAVTLSLFSPEGVKEEEEKREGQREAEEKCSESIEVIDVELGNVADPWQKQISPKPIFHGGKIKILFIL